jgi:hypothetical protein
MRKPSGWHLLFGVVAFYGGLAGLWAELGWKAASLIFAVAIGLRAAARHDDSSA